MRTIGIAIALALAACTQAPEPVVAASPPEPPAAPAAPPALAAPPAWMTRLTETAKASRMTLNYTNGVFSGPAWDQLVAEGIDAQYFLVGEEHGIAENPKLMGQLFERLAKDGYSRFIIEVSPPMATALDAAAAKGIGPLTDMLLTPGSAAAFFTMQEEAEMLARARAAVTTTGPVFWGVDYEVGGDRHLIGLLEAMKKPKAAVDAVAALRKASTEAWAKHAAEKNPGFIFSFSGDPELVKAVRAAWPDAPPEAVGIMDALQRTLEINALWVAGKGYDSNVMRSGYMRENFLAHWTTTRVMNPQPKVFGKMGASHLMRGRNSTETYDIGSLVPEVAMMEGTRAVQVMILPGKGRETAVFDPVNWVFRAAAPKDNYMQGLDPLYAAADPDAFTLIDLRPLRPILGNWRTGVDPELMRIVHGFDMLLIMSGSTASKNLERR